MKKKLTIRDVAEKAGVSISSVHIALSGKSGVSDSTRAYIRQVAETLGYQPNAYASKLKQRTKQVVILLPDEKGDNSFYYPEIWHGIHDYQTSSDANVDFTEISYGPDTEQEAFSTLRRLVENGEADGILAAGHIDKEKLTPKDWAEFAEKGVSVVFIISGNRHSPFLCCVQPDYRIIGRTMAELVLSRIPDYGSILMLAGNPKWPSHFLVANGFTEYMTENRRSNMIYYDHSWSTSPENYEAIKKELSRSDIAACCSVYSIGTALLCQALKESGKAGRVYAVGSDLSAQAIEGIRHGILNNSIQKNPYAQGYVGLRTLVDYLVDGKTPEEKCIFVGCEVVFQSNLPMYEHRRYSNLFF